MKEYLDDIIVYTNNLHVQYRQWRTGHREFGRFPGGPQLKGPPTTKVGATQLVTSKKHGSL